VVLGLASLQGSSPETVGRIAEVLDQKLKAVVGGGRKPVAGVRMVADLLNRTDPAFADSLLERMEKRDKQRANEVRDLLFVFEDLVKLDAEGIKELAKRVDRKSLTMALKGTSDELRAHIFETMSKRASEMMREDMEALGAVKIRDVEAAQKELLQLARSLEQEGVLRLSTTETEQYVV
jgi:flagellar motor switch protein FliG